MSFIQPYCWLQRCHSQSYFHVNIYHHWIQCQSHSHQIFLLIYVSEPNWKYVVGIQNVKIFIRLSIKILICCSKEGPDSNITLTTDSLISWSLVNRQSIQTPPLVGMNENIFVSLKWKESFFFFFFYIDIPVSKLIKSVRMPRWVPYSWLYRP